MTPLLMKPLHLLLTVEAAAVLFYEALDCDFVHGEQHSRRPAETTASLWQESSCNTIRLGRHFTFLHNSPSWTPCPRGLEVTIN